MHFLSFSKRQVLVLFCVWLAFTASFVTRLSWPTVMPIAIKALQFNISEGALYISAFYIGYALTVLPGGMVADKWGYKRIIVICLIGMMAFTLPMYWLENFHMGLIYRFLLGCFSGPLHSACMSAIGDYFKASQRGTAVGLYMTASSFGITLVNMIAPLVSSYYGWRMAFFAVSLIPFVVLFLTIFGIKDYDTLEKKPTNKGASHRDGTTGTENYKKNESTPSIKESLLFVLTNKSILFLAFAGLFATGTTWGVVNWANQYMVKQLGVTTVMAGSVMSSFGIAALIAKPVSGYISDVLHIGRNKLAALFLFILGPVIALFAWNTSPSNLFWLGPLLGVSAFIYSPLTNTLCIQSAPENLRGTVVGFVNLFNQIGSLSAPLLLSQIVVQTQSYQQSLYTIAFFPVLGAILLLMMKLSQDK